jgi:hypothetical protein
MLRKLGSEEQIVESPSFCRCQRAERKFRSRRKPLARVDLVLVRRFGTDELFSTPLKSAKPPGFGGATCFSAGSVRFWRQLTFRFCRREF